MDSGQPLRGFRNDGQRGIRNVGWVERSETHLRMGAGRFLSPNEGVALLNSGRWSFGCCPNLPVRSDRDAFGLVGAIEDHCFRPTVILPFQGRGD